MESADMTIPLCVPSLEGNEWKYIKECLDTGWVSYAGPFVERFEVELASRAGSPYATAVASGTAALHAALVLAGVSRDDEVVMPGMTFVAPANAVRYCGAWPTLVDIRMSDWQLDMDQVRCFLEEGCKSVGGKLVNRRTGRRVAALLVVHLLGGMCDVDAAGDLASRFQLPLIEDAAQCLGAEFRGRRIASPCPTYHGPLRIVTTSFNGNKIVTTGGGGAIFSQSKAVADRAKHITTTAKADRVEFEHDEVGYNYRLTNIAAALGVAQLERLEEHVAIKRRIAHRYVDLLTECPQIRVHPEPEGCRSIFWLYSVQLDRPARPIIDELIAAGILARPVWVPLRQLPAFKGFVFEAGSAVTRDFYRRTLSIPCSVDLNGAQLGRVASTLRRLVARDCGR